MLFDANDSVYVSVHQVCTMSTITNIQIILLFLVGPLKRPNALHHTKSKKKKLKRENREKITSSQKYTPFKPSEYHLCDMKTVSVFIHLFMCRWINSVTFYLCLSPIFTWFRPEKKNQQQQQSQHVCVHLHFTLQSLVLLSLAHWTWRVNEYTHTHTIYEII